MPNATPPSADSSGYLSPVKRRLVGIGDGTVATCLQPPAHSLVPPYSFTAYGKSTRLAMGQGSARRRKRTGDHARSALPPHADSRPCRGRRRSSPRHTSLRSARGCGWLVLWRQCHQPGRSRRGVRLAPHLHLRHTTTRRISPAKISAGLTPIRTSSSTLTGNACSTTTCG
jgi:hypothetical protein